MGTIFGFVVAAALALPISGFGPVCAGSDLLPTITSPSCVSQGTSGGDGFADADDDDDDDARRGGDDDGDEGEARRPARGADDDTEAKGEDKAKPRRGGDDDDKPAAPKGSEGSGDSERAVGGDRDGF